MEFLNGRQRPKLERRNALKHIDYDASCSAPQSPCVGGSLDRDYPFGGSLPSFRVHGVDGKEEIDRICRLLGLSGPEAFAIPAAAWEARKAKSLRTEEQSENVELQPQIVRSSCPSSLAVVAEEEAIRRRHVRQTSSVAAVAGSFDDSGGEYGRSRSDGDREAVCSIRSRDNSSEISTLSGDLPPFTGPVARRARSPVVAPPPSMFLPVPAKSVSTWDLVKSLAPEDDDSCSSDEGSSSPINGNDVVNDGEVDREEKGTEVEPAGTSLMSNRNKSSSTTTEEAVYVVSPDAMSNLQFRYWIKGEMLGRGSFGTVFEGISDDGFFFAVKEVLLSDQSSNAKQCISQLEQEIALLSQFEHENIVRYLGTDKEQDRLYIFLELITQGSLASLYRKYRLIDSQVRAYTRQILNGLKYLHDRDVVHRDIKCANILVDANGHVKLADFGLAKETSKLNELKSCKGSAYWMAPEVINPRKTYSLPADIWSLGCTVLEMATGRLPFGDLEWHRVLWEVGHGKLPPLPDTLSRDAKDFIEQCLQVEPTDRPSAGRLLEHPFVRRSFSEEYVRAPRAENRFQKQH